MCAVKAIDLPQDTCPVSGRTKRGNEMLTFTSQKPEGINVCVMEQVGLTGIRFSKGEHTPWGTRGISV